MSKQALVVKHFPAWAAEEPLVKVVGDGPEVDGVIKSTIIRVLPTPFGSPNQKDLHGQFFIPPADKNPGTYFGDDIYAKGGSVVKPGLYEHGMNGFNNPEFEKFGKMANILGPATLVKAEGDPNRWFEIEVQRSLQYHDLLLDLIDLKIMGASTQAFMNNVEVNDDGGITYWLENEVGPTVNPANPNSIKMMADLLKKNTKYISLPPMTVKMWKSANEEEEVVVQEVEETETAEAPEASIEDEIAEIFGTEVSEEIPAELTEEAVQALEKMLGASLSEIKEHTKFMSVFIELWGGDYEEIKQNLTDLIGSAKTMKDLARKQDDQMKLLKALSLFVKESRMSAAAEKFNAMSPLEKELLSEHEETQQKSYRRPRSPIPHGAPGTN